MLLALACLLPLTVGAHPAHVAGMVHPTALGADATFDARGRLWLVTATRGHVVLQHSDDFGKTFSRPVAVNAVAEDIDATRENRPRIALGPQAQIYVSWAHPLAKQWASEVRFARSLDGGETFSQPVTLNAGPADVTHSFNVMTVAGNGDVVVAWLDGRAMATAMAAGQTHHGLSVYYSWSADGGKTFAPNRELMDHSCECCRMALAHEPDGRVAVLFRSVLGNNIRDHAFAILRTDGEPLHWQRATWSNWQIAACPEQGPGLAIGADGVRHAVWYESAHGPAIWYGQLDPGHLAHHKLKIGGPGAGHADVAAKGRDVWIVWNQVSTAGYTLMLRASRDGGVHFNPARAIATSSTAVGSPQLLLHAGAAYVAWNTAQRFRLIATAEGL